MTTYYLINGLDVVAKTEQPSVKDAFSWRATKGDGILVVPVAATNPERLHSATPQDEINSATKSNIDRAIQILEATKKGLTKAEKS